MNSVLFQHFWLLCGLWCGLGNGVLIWARRRRYVEAGLFSESEVTTFARGAVLWILAPALILWGLQLSIGSAVSPMFLDWPAPQQTIALMLQVLVWLALAYWVFARNGAQSLAAYFSVPGKGPEFMRTPTAMKIGTALAIAAGIAAVFARNA